MLIKRVRGKGLLLSCLLLLIGGQAAFANFNLSASLTQSPSGPMINLQNAVTGGSLVLTPLSGIVTGSVSGMYAAPWVHGDPAAWSGDYLYVAGKDAQGNPAAGSATLNFGQQETFFQLLWGSVDTYNTLSFYKGGVLQTAFTGSNVANPADGNRGDGGSYWVNITATGGDSFDSVVFTSSQNSFEAAAFSTPEPGFYGVLALGLSGLLFAARRRSAA